MHKKLHQSTILDKSQELLILKLTTGTSSACDEAASVVTDLLVNGVRAWRLNGMARRARIARVNMARTGGESN